MKQLSVDEAMKILGKLEKPFNDMVDWHIAFFQEPDENKQKLYHAIYESKEKAYYELKEQLFKQYEQY